MGAPKKGSKFGGLKGFVTYPITPDFSNIQVEFHISIIQAEQLTAKLLSLPAGEPALQTVRLAVREALWQVRDCDRHPPSPRQAGHRQVRGGPHRAQVLTNFEEAI